MGNALEVLFKHSVFYEIYKLKIFETNLLLEIDYRNVLFTINTVDVEIKN